MFGCRGAPPSRWGFGISRAYRAPSAESRLVSTASSPARRRIHSRRAGPADRQSRTGQDPPGSFRAYKPLPLQYGTSRPRRPDDRTSEGASRPGRALAAPSQGSRSLGSGKIPTAVGAGDDDGRAAGSSRCRGNDHYPDTDDSDGGVSPTHRGRARSARRSRASRTSSVTGGRKGVPPPTTTGLRNMRSSSTRPSSIAAAATPIGDYEVASAHGG
jgi:hypothetical protein